MSKKYVIEMKSEYEDTIRGIMVLGARDSNLYMDALAVEDLEELNSDYINEHYGDMQDTAYQQGLEEGKKTTWEAVRKVIRLPEGVVLDLFTDCYSSVCTVLQVFLKYEGSEVIEKLKAYEEKADDEIKVGDEVINIPTQTKGILLEPETKHLLATVIVPDQRWRTINIRHANLTKTGKHYDIDKILEEMRT